MPMTIFRVCNENDRSDIGDFLESVKEDFAGFDRNVIDNVVERTFKRGGAIAAYQDKSMVGMLGYLHGEPSLNFANREVGYMYLTALAPRVRLTRVFPDGLLFTMQIMQDIGIEQVRFHALKTNPYTNRLYERFARCIGEEENLRGYVCNLYAASVSEVLASLSGWRRDVIKQPTPDSYHPNGNRFQRRHEF